ncbi:Endocytosis and vacuole integrity protein [Elasticomyces elasticus]|nr:Endocytosis and vacuole integrity protein [Elasticomyces elasticus]
MTAAFLQSELTSLIQDSKRKHPGVLQAAESSLAGLKAISVTSETQVVGDLVRKLHFIEPFLLALQSQNAKLASTAATGMQRLVSYSAIPTGRVEDVLTSLESGVKLSTEVQLKILQTLPALVQQYDLHGQNFFRVLNLSAGIVNSKDTVAVGIASASLQQLILGAIETPDDTSQDSDGKEGIKDVPTIFNDLSLLIAGKKPKHINVASLPQMLTLACIESMLLQQGTIILENEACLESTTNFLIPTLVILCVEGRAFNTTAYACRIGLMLVHADYTGLNPSRCELLNDFDCSSECSMKKMSWT